MPDLLSSSSSSKFLLSPSIWKDVAMYRDGWVQWFPVLGMCVLTEGRPVAKAAQVCNGADASLLLALANTSLNIQRIRYYQYKTNGHTVNLYHAMKSLLQHCPSSGHLSHCTWSLVPIPRDKIVSTMVPDGGLSGRQAIHRLQSSCVDSAAVPPPRGHLELS
jgi:hypothetical protein